MVRAKSLFLSSRGGEASGGLTNSMSVGMSIMGCTAGPEDSLRVDTVSRVMVMSPFCGW